MNDSKRFLAWISAVIGGGAIIEMGWWWQAGIVAAILYLLAGILGASVE